jgi:hypothetical protein
MKQQKDAFVRSVKYYNFPTPTNFLAAYDKVTFSQQALHDPNSIRIFMEELVEKLMVDEYQVNSYLQEELVLMYATAEKMLQIESRPTPLNYNAQEAAAVEIAAECLFERLILFGPRLESTLQRGEINLGFHRQVPLWHGKLAQAGRFFWTFFYELACAHTNRDGYCALPHTVKSSKATGQYRNKPVAVETFELLSQMKELSDHCKEPTLHREIVELRSLYHATKESYVCNLILIVSSISFFTGIVFTVGNIGASMNMEKPWVAGLLAAGSITFGTITPLTALLAAQFLCRKLRHIVKCSGGLTSRLRAPDLAKDDESRAHLVHVRWVCRIQMFVTLIRIAANFGAAVSLPWALAARQGVAGLRNPLFVALFSLCLHALSIVFLFLIEYSVLYNLTPRLAEYVCGAFHEELMDEKALFEQPIQSTLTEQVQERAKWEYVARSFLHNYRFDTVFAADRFGNFFQYIQSGLLKCARPDPKDDNFKLEVFYSKDTIDTVC